MSHFSRITTKISDERLLMRVLRELDYQPQQGNLSARGFNGRHTGVDVLIRSKTTAYDVGFRKEGKYYVCVADWMGVDGINKQKFLENVNQGYANLVVKDQLAAQGFSLADERKEDGRIHLVLRRME